MGKTLTKARIKALAWIAESPNKSGAYWRDLGVSPATISWLEDARLIRTATFPVIGNSSVVIRSTWVATDAGRAALEAQP